MSKIHILEGDENGNYHAAIHYAVPTGTNSANKPWSDCLIEDGHNTTILTTIDAAELLEIQAGTIVEMDYQIKALESGGGTLTTILASINEMVDEAIAEDKKYLARRYKHYGRVI